MLLWTLTLISMDRHRCIVVPPYRSQLTPSRAAALTALTWLIALAVFMPVPFWFHEQPVLDGTVNICTLVFPKNDTFRMSIVFTASVVSLSCLLPLSLFVYYYQRIFHKLNKMRRLIDQSNAHRSKAPPQNNLSLAPPAATDTSYSSQVRSHRRTAGSRPSVRGSLFGRFGWSRVIPKTANVSPVAGGQPTRTPPFRFERNVKGKGRPDQKTGAVFPPGVVTRLVRSIFLFYSEFDSPTSVHKCFPLWSQNGGFGVNPDTTNVWNGPFGSARC